MMPQKIQNDIDELMLLTEQIRTKVVKNNLMKKAEGVTILQAGALMYISLNEKVTLSDLSTHLGISASSTTQLVDRLVESKIILKETDKSDKRVSWISLTPKGKRNIEKFKKQLRERMREILTKVPQEDIRDMLRIQKNILRVIENEKREL